MAKIINQKNELLDLLYEKSAKIVFDLLNRITVAQWNNNREQEQSLTEELADMISSTRAYADMLGRRRILLRLKNRFNFQELVSAVKIGPFEIVVGPTEENPIIPRTPFQEAIDELVRKMPALKSSADEVNEFYTIGNSFHIAKSTTLTLTERIQKEIADGIRTGKPVADSADLISRLGDWTHAYSTNVYRTNLNTSYHAGQFQIMKDEDVRAIVPAFRFVATLDSDVRDNHKAMHNVIASIDDPIWERLSPPLGYQCRCSLITMDAITLKQRGIDPTNIPRARIPSGAHPDSFSFGRRPGMDVYGV